MFRKQKTYNRNASLEDDQTGETLLSTLCQFNLTKNKYGLLIDPFEGRKIW